MQRLGSRAHPPLNRSAALINFVNRTNHDNAPLLDEEQLAVIEKYLAISSIASSKASNLWDQEALLKLPPDQIDLARGLLLAESGPDRQKIRSYEANIEPDGPPDLRRLPENATSLEKVRAINDYIFSEMRFRFSAPFPPRQRCGRLYLSPLGPR